MPFFCCDCNYKTERKSNWIKHLETSKHISNVCKKRNLDKMPPKNKKSTISGMSSQNPQKMKIHSCEFCGKEYKHLSGLSRHKRECPQNNNMHINKKIDNERLLSEQHDQIITLQQLLEKSIDSNNNTLNNLLPKIGTTTNNYNNQMTINLYLNEECKNAMNLTEFLNKLHLTLDDLIYTKNNGYTKGIANIFLKHLCDMPANSRPIHCSDKKRLQFYVKDENKWEKDNQNEKLDKSIHDISQKQIQQLKFWEQRHPNWHESEEETASYIELVKQVMGGLSDQDKQQNLETIKRELGGNINIQSIIDKK